MIDWAAKKKSFIERFKRGHSLRFHMTLILMVTAAAGLLATRIMLTLGLKNVMIRYPLAVLAAYLVFLLCIKLWLKLVVSLAKSGSSGSFNLGNVSFSGSSSGSSGGSYGSSDFKGGGGSFGGGGASGSFVQVPVVLPESGAEAASAAADTGGSAAGAFGDAVSSLDLDKGWLVVLVVGIIAAVVLGAGIFLIYEAPLILSDAAFNFILAGGLARGARRIASGDWVGSVFQATWKPLVLTLLLTFLAAFIMHHYFPGATRVSELFAAGGKH